jgi:DNA-binding NtrC family response regulator
MTARCLVVDDDPQVLNALVRVVQAQGLECLSAASADDALTLLERSGEVAVLISDIRMPGTDGVALLEEVRRRFPDTAVIMLRRLGGGLSLPRDDRVLRS